jgi:hypothetical protein
VVPAAVAWAVLLASTGFLWREYISTHDELLRLQLTIGAEKEASERAYGLAASCESRVDVAERKIERLERDR